jgi:PAS domain S-box-containing protein
VLYLNELRHRKGTALMLNLPLEGAGSPASRAVLAGTAQVVEASEYRGIVVLAATRPVKGTPWHLVAKIDREEVLAPLQDLVFWVSLVAMSAVLVVGLSMLLLWRQQQRAHQLELVAQAGEKDRLLRSFFDLPFVGMSIASADTGKWLQLNDRLCEILGYAREELAERTWTQLTHPADLAADLAQLERLSNGASNSYQSEKRFVRQDASVITATVDVKAVRRADGGVESLVATVQDITQRKRTEEALRQSEARLAHAQAVAQLGNYEIQYAASGEQAMIALSAEAYRILGLDPSGPSRTLADLLGVVHPDDRWRVEASYRAARGHGSGKREIEYRIRCADGVQRVIHDVAETGRDSEGRRGYVFGIIQDISARRQAEEAARTAEGFAQEVLDNVNQGLAVYDDALRLLVWNRFLEHSLGVARKAAIGKHLYELFPNVREHGIEAYVQCALAGETVVADRFVARLRGTTEPLAPEAAAAHREDPRLFWTLSSFAPHRNANGDIEGVLVNVIDVTALKRSQGSLMESNERLRQLTQYLERVREEERVRIARELHDDLGSTLTGVKWAVAMAIDRAQEAALPPDAQLAHASQLLDSAVDTMRRIISDLRPSVLDQLGVWTAIEWYAGQIQQQTELRCEVSIPEDIAEIDLDPERATAVFRIVQEALTNIVRHAQASRAEIHARREANDVMISIEDDGVGIGDEARVKTESWGLLGMQERAAPFGGQVSVSRGATEGSSVVLRIPV